VSKALPPRAASGPSPRVMTAIAVLLTFASGASDVTSFTRLGNVFTSVMTGNITVFGLSLARGSASLAMHTALAFAGYVAGVAASTLVARYRTARASAGSTATPTGEQWPAHMTLTLAAELTMLTGVLAGWEVTGSRPAGWAQYVILAVAACAMGIQSAAVVQLGLGNASTTYLTGTLTGLVSEIFRADTKVGWRRPGVLAGLLAGASLAGLLVASAAWAVPCLPLLGVTTATVLGARSVNSR
jgi:uncharacterized membrane protein YoaK (UPF0700 family)